MLAPPVLCASAIATTDIVDGGPEHLSPLLVNVYILESYVTSTHGELLSTYKFVRSPLMVARYNLPDVNPEDEDAQMA